MTNINSLIKYAEERNIALDEPLRVYVAVADAKDTLVYEHEEMKDEHGALWEAYPHQDEDGFQLILREITPRRQVVD